MAPPDLTAWIARHFSSRDQSAAIQLIDAAVDHAENPADDRLKRCAALASRGDLGQLRYYVDLLRVDWRDVIVAGEYGAGPGLELRRVRDLSLPIVD